MPDSVKAALDFVQTLFGIAAGVYGVRVYRKTRGGSDLFLYFAVFAVLVGVIGVFNLVEDASMWAGMRLAEQGSVRNLEEIRIAGAYQALANAVEALGAAIAGVAAVLCGASLARFVSRGRR